MQFTKKNDSRSDRRTNLSLKSGADPGGGGSWGADDPPFSLKMMASFRKIEPFSLAKLQLFQIFSSYCSIMHSNLTSKVPNLVEIEHFTVKKQLTSSRSRQLGAWLITLRACPKICVRASRAYGALTPLS